jgi:glycosyltransferase involved in cell wall biosynthesis
MGAIRWPDTLHYTPEIGSSRFKRRFWLTCGLLRNNLPKMAVKKLPISVCVISGAEQHRIGKALASVAEWTSDIVVVLNQDVADGTDAAAAEFGAKVFREPWRGYIAQKNSAADKASQPWLLGLDADEVVSEPLRQEITELFAPVPAGVAYSFPRRSYYLGRWIGHGDWYPDRCSRLWAKGRARWGGVDPHGELRADGPVLKLRHDLHHFTAETLDQQVAKTVRYAEDFARHCAETGRKVGSSDLVLRPAWRFARGYFLKRGFLDGWQGYSIACMTAFYTFLRYAKAREAQLARKSP